MRTNNPREAAFLASSTASLGTAYASDLLDSWQREQTPSPADARLARQICYGTIQMALALDHLARRLTNHGTLKVKARERILLRNALYQAYFLERTPLYSVVDESVRIANKHFHPNFGKFLNALLRSYEIKQPKLPTGTDLSSLSIRHSYPELFVQQLLDAYGLDKTQEILSLGNQPAKIMTRLRNNISAPPQTTQLLNDSLHVIRLDDPSSLSALTNSADYYIQNVTPAYLLSSLAKVSKTPATILDLCAAPGGKTIALHDLFPNAQITANDPSEERLDILRANLNKYGLTIPVTCHPGENFPATQKFDLIVLDVPCSNSGVLNKRPEARWRLTTEALQQLQTTQNALIQHALTLLNPGGQLWYLTCSILPCENEALCEHRSAFMKTVLPNGDGWDGGFCSLLD